MANCFTVAVCLICFMQRSFGFIENEIGSRYFIGEFNSDEFPFAIDKCQPTIVIPNQAHQKFECISGTTVKKTTYTDDECSIESTVKVPQYYNLSTIAGKTGLQYSGELYDFNCDFMNNTNYSMSYQPSSSWNDSYILKDKRPANDAYAKVTMTAGTCSSKNSFVTVYAALNVCTQQELNLDATLMVQCQTWPNLISEIQYYNFGSNCSQNDLLYIRNSSDECDWLLQSSTAGVTVDVYAETLNCVNCGDPLCNRTINEDTDTNDSGDNDGTVAAMVMISTSVSSLVAVIACFLSV